MDEAGEDVVNIDHLVGDMENEVKAKFRAGKPRWSAGAWSRVYDACACACAHLISAT